MKTIENVITEIFNTLEEALLIIFTPKSNENQPISVRVPVSKNKK